MTSSSDVRKKIEAVNARFMTLFADGDLAGVCTLYTEDAMVMMPGMPALSHRSGVATFLGAVESLGVKQAKLATEEVEAMGDTAWERGNYELKLGNGTVADHGKYIVIWKLRNGTWELHRDIFNTDRPPPAG